MTKKVVIAALVAVSLAAGTLIMASGMKSDSGKSPVVKEVWGTDNK